MNTQEKTKIALQAIETHLQIYESFHPTIPQRFLDLWNTGEAFKYDSLLLPDAVEVPTWDPEVTFRLHTVAPSWYNQCLLLDDAVVGPIGDWKHASNYLPFMIGDGFCIVAKLDDAKCPVGLFIEGFWNMKDSKTYHQGVFKLNDSLDDFLASLVENSELELVDQGVEEEAAFPEYVG